MIKKPQIMIKLLKTIMIAMVFLLISQQNQAQNPILIPDTLSGSNITLNLQTGTYQFRNGVTTNTMGANGNILGPTLLLNKGQQLNVTVNNNITDTTTIHWHGMHVSASNDGGPHTIILPGNSWHPAFTVMDNAATYWYHPHLHRKTNIHVSKGIAGFIIVRDSAEASLNLPRHYGVDDFPVVIQTKTFDASGQIVVPSNADSVIMANATIDAYLDAPAQVIRLRLLNGSSQRVFKLGLSGNKSFKLITTDGGLLAAPLSLTRLQLAPGERAEILIDLSSMQGQSIYLKSYASELADGIYGATNPGTMSFMTMTDYNPNILNGADFNILKLNVVTATSNPITSIPTTLVPATPISPSLSNITRNVTFSPAVMGQNQLNGHFLINGTSFDMNVVNYTIPLNNVEIWSLKNNSAIAHPFHIHDVQFYILDRNGVAPPAEEQGRKDVVLVKAQETVRFIAVFEDFADDNVPYMYHCHMLTHEDMGMMGQFAVSTTSIGIESPESISFVDVFPNPSNGSIEINSGNNTQINQVDVYTIDGKLVLSNTETNRIIKLNNLPKGMLFIRISTDEGIQTEKIIVQ